MDPRGDPVGHRRPQPVLEPTGLGDKGGVDPERPGLDLPGKQPLEDRGDLLFRFELEIKERKWFKNTQAVATYNPRETRPFFRIVQSSSYRFNSLR